MTNILTPQEQRVQMKARILTEIELVEKALADYRKSIMVDVDNWSNSEEYLYLLDAVYSLTEIDGITDKIDEIEKENADDCKRLERERWEDEADYRYEEMRDRKMMEEWERKA